MSQSVSISITHPQLFIHLNVILQCHCRCHCRCWKRMNNCELVTGWVWACGETGKSIPSHSPITNAHTTLKYESTYHAENTARRKEDGVAAIAKLVTFTHSFIIVFALKKKKKTCWTDFRLSFPVKL